LFVLEHQTFSECSKKRYSSLKNPDDHDDDFPESFIQDDDVREIVHQ